MERLLRRLNAPTDVASLALFRVAFGLLIALSSARFVANGWVQRFYGDRTFFFHYWGFDWVTPWPLWGMYLHYAVIGVSALLVAVGLYYRAAAVALFLSFTYAELIDVTNYLNHYYLVSLLMLWLCVLPLNAALSLDALRRPERARASVPAWMLLALRCQVAVVYVYAGLAKWGSDWLSYGQPLNLWLNARRDLPLLGEWLSEPSMAIVVGWAGFLHDLLVVPLLLSRRTRVFGYLWLLTFHFGTHLLFNIGIFPFLMPMAATLFFAPDWPRRGLKRLGRWLSPAGAQRTRGLALGPVGRSGRARARARARGARQAAHLDPARGFVSSPLGLGPVGASLLGLYVLVQVALPLRTHLYGGNVLWHEQGMRWSWRVMLREKQGAITYRVTLPSGRGVDVHPRKYLTSDQEREMAGQPDLILQLAHHIADDFAARGKGPVQVRVDALVSLNGRRPLPMIDPKVDLTQIRDGIAPASWIMPPPTEPPPVLGGRRVAISWP